jgi:SulP family sulfate permease
VAVGVGIFIANILTIERLSELQSNEVKIISDTDDEVPISPTEKALLDEGHGRILLFYLSGPMIFGVSKAISREHNALGDFDVLVFDLSNVTVLGVTASLAVENAIQEAVEKGRKVLIVGANEKVKSRLDKLGLSNLIPAEHMIADRTTALKEALVLQNQMVLDRQQTSV